jgi:hypothetical protein
MSCAITRGFSLLCNEGIGGVKAIYLGNFDDFNNGDVTIANGIVTALPAATIFEYQPNRNTGSMTMTPNSNLENGTLFFTQAVEFTIGKLEPLKHDQFNRMSKGRVVAFIQTYDDEIMMLGRTDGAFLTAGTYQTGKAKGDMNGYMVTLTAEEQELCPFLTPFTDGVPFSNFEDIIINR